MQEILSTFSTLLWISSIIFFFIMFYLSIKKCFWKDDINKVKLFFLTLLTNPFALFAVSFIATMSITLIIMIYVIISANPIDQKEVVNEVISQVKSTFVLSLSVEISWFFCLIFIILFAYFIGKWLKAPNKSLVIFIYIMFTIIFASFLLSHDSLNMSPLLQSIVNIIDTIIQSISLILLYHFDIKALSKMTNERQEINWRIFVIPPTILSIFRVLLSAYSTNNKGFTIAIYIFSNVFTLLFIWAFYVIIQNINATNDAIKAKNEVKTLSVEVMEALAHTIDAKDEYTRGHSVRVAKYSRMIAQRLNLTSEECENVYYMALLHDIGKIGVPNEIINSTTKLTDDEYAVIKTHPGVGYDILAEIKSRPDLSIGARWHHERFDGKGYPDGKKGEEIPFFARIIAVADSYDAMTSNRSYRKYMPQDKVRSEIENNMGTQFDPKVAKCMLSIIDEDVNYELHE